MGGLLSQACMVEIVLAHKYHSLTYHIKREKIIIVMIEAELNTINFFHLFLIKTLIK